MTVAYTRNFCEAIEEKQAEGKLSCVSALHEFYRAFVAAQFAAGGLWGRLDEPELPAELLAQAGAQTEGAVGAVFSRCAAELRRRTSTVQFAMQTALSHTPGLALPQSAQRALLALSASLGKFDVDGQCRAIDLAAACVGEALEDVEQASRARCRSYRTLGVCAGLAIAVILL